MRRSLSSLLCMATSSVSASTSSQHAISDTQLPTLSSPSRWVHQCFHVTFTRLSSWIFFCYLWIPQEVDIGLAPDIGSLSYLPKITGNQSLVRELTYTARPFLASEAEKLGLVSKVVQGGRDEVVKSALELAKLIATKSPIAVSSSKHLLTHSRDHRWEISLHGSSSISALLLPAFF